MYFQKVALIFLVAFVCLAYGLDKEKDCKCKLTASARIIGGKRSANRFPWFASVSGSGFFLDPENTSDEIRAMDHSCGATILNEKFLITSAHCIDSYDTKTIAIGVGDNDLLAMFNNGKLKVKRTIFYPAYTKKWGVDDVALIELQEPLKFNEKIAPACLGAIERLSELDENELLSIGHGVEHPESNEPSRFLKEVSMKDVSLSKCLSSPKLICMEAAKKGHTVCTADDGGAMHLVNNGKTYVVGVLSKTGKDLHHECNGEAEAQRMSAFYKFIQDKAGDVCNMA